MDGVFIVGVFRFNCNLVFFIVLVVVGLKYFIVIFFWLNFGKFFIKELIFVGLKNNSIL